MASKAEVIGEIVCECGRCAYVEQTKRKGGFLQVRCSACGVDQRTGKTVQAGWKSIMKPVGYYHDSKSVAAFGSVSVEKAADTKADTIENSADTPKEVEKKTPSEPVVARVNTMKKQPKKSSGGAWLGLGVFIVCAGVSVLSSELLKVSKG